MYLCTCTAGENKEDFQISISFRYISDDACYWIYWKAWSEILKDPAAAAGCLRSEIKDIWFAMPLYYYVCEPKTFFQGIMKRNRISSSSSPPSSLFLQPSLSWWIYSIVQKNISFFSWWWKKVILIAGRSFHLPHLLLLLLLLLCVNDFASSLFFVKNLLIDLISLELFFLPLYAVRFSVRKFILARFLWVFYYYFKHFDCKKNR